MSASLTVTAADKAGRYRELLPQLAALIGSDTDAIAVMANVSAALKEAFGWHWVGFYRVEGDTLVLGPFQGPVACTRIPHGRGVCGSAWARNETLVVADVDAFPGHIACSSLSRSEIVVPLTDCAGRVAAVLDIDSVHLADFDDTDRASLEALIPLFAPCLSAQG
ncbi:GAF domain-containing protein [Crenobacter intestini]|uniref:GAF domain-containing protein n=1 Tax=Crenobacter intestini TaxID=2563443 RepID=A0A4T0V5X7_9NEIS|nr:GAF domain-containing protein [Crenobacter intestini]TIC87009.1 GAF domain-containing protein [Crenobacter intestini]